MYNMKKKTPFPMTPFDMLVVPEQLHMMKLFLPYLPSGTQKMLALWIKCQELTNTIAYFRDYPRIGMGECTPQSRSTPWNFSRSFVLI